MKIKKEFIVKTKSFLKNLSNKILRQKILESEIKIIHSKLNYFKDNKIHNLKETLDNKAFELELLKLSIDSDYIYINFLEDHLKEIIIKRYFNTYKYNELISYIKLTQDLNISESTAKRYVSKGINDLSYILYGDVIFDQ